MNEAKEPHFEAIRGVAALTVLFWHCIYGFAPGQEKLLMGWPGFVVMNGPGAVWLFFVLSAYVLSRRYFIHRDDTRLLRAAIKRWPRLMGPALFSVLAAYALFKLGLYYYEEAGKLSGSTWLESYARGFATTKYPIEFWGAVEQGAFLTFFRGDSWYNTSLWTMRLEFLGSLLTFGLAPLLYTAKNNSIFALIALVLLAGTVIQFTDPSYIAFLAGTTLACTLPVGGEVRRAFIVLLLLAALYLMAYPNGAIGLYSFIVIPSSFSAYPWVLGSVFLIAAFELSSGLRGRFSGKTSMWLGRISFPIYVMQVPVICSVGSFTYIHSGAVSAIGATLLTTLLCGALLSYLNDIWLIGVNALSDLILVRGLNRKPKMNAAVQAQTP
jgi:peptidoglycan/LPS O-acetylase OafA/YrhL